MIVGRTQEKNRVKLGARQKMIKSSSSIKSAHNKKERRHEILRYIRNHLRLTSQQKKFTFPKSDRDMVTSKFQGDVSISLPIKFSKPIHYSLPLPQV